MPVRAKELTAIEVKRLREGTHAVGGVSGLCLQVGSVGSKSWILRVVIGTKRREIGLGPYPEVSLSVARSTAAEMKAQIRNGIDPLEERKTLRARLAMEQQRGLLFEEAVSQFAPIKASELAAGKYRDQWRDSVDKYAVPELGKMAVQDIALADILRVLEPIWLTKHVTADKLRRKLNEILDYCTVKGHRSGPNPARWDGNLSHVLGAAAKTVGGENFPALQLQDLPRFWEALSRREGMGAAALSFQILTATRMGAIRGMTWSEVDFENRVWTVQPERQWSKIGKKDGAKRVPLTDMMIDILRNLPRQADADLVFWAPRGGALSDATLGKLMRVLDQADIKAGNAGFKDAKTGATAVPHGNRSAFKNWAIERTQFEWQLSEAALWHKLGNKVESAYARSDLLEKRREMMARWQSFLTDDSDLDD